MPNDAVTDDPILNVDGIDVHYGGIHAIKNVSLTVKKGHLTALIGANGAGKTTTLKAICGIKPPSKGTVEFESEEITGSPAHLNVSRGLVLCPEGRRIFPDLTVDENLSMGAYTRRDQEVNSDLKSMHEMIHE